MKTGQRNLAPPPSFQRPPIGSGSVQRARHFSSETAPQRQPEHYVVRDSRATNQAIRELRRARVAMYVCAVLLVATAFGSAAFLYGVSNSQLRSGQPVTSIESLVFEDGRSDRAREAGVKSTSVRSKDDTSPVQGEFSALPPRAVGETPADIIARGFSALEPRSRQSSNDNRNVDTKTDRLSSAAPLENVPPLVSTRTAIAPLLPRNMSNREAKTTLVDFETAPFPYHGNMPGSEKRFLDSGESENRGHTNFRGRVLREATTFNDRRVLLHIPPGFDTNKPGVIVVFFHGHGANLSDDVRDRQQVPAQISASGANVVMVAPQFAVNAADSSSGKFWEQDGFKRFMDESAKQFAKLNGDPKAARAFARMPIVIVAYSGGFGPTLSVLERGGANSRIRGIVLLDALYAGTEKFANWIASNKSAFFVSSYTPHTRRLNAELEQLLDNKSIVYGSELKPTRLAGSVTFLPAGDISHRDFVNRAWVDSPIKDILVRLDEVAPSSNAANSDMNSKPSVARR